MGVLSDRIMGQLPDDLNVKEYGYYDGFAQASRQAATIASEADELMEKLVDALESAADMLEVHKELGSEYNCRALVTKYNDWKERTK